MFFFGFGVNVLGFRVIGVLSCFFLGTGSATRAQGGMCLFVAFSALLFNYCFGALGPESVGWGV